MAAPSAAAFARSASHPPSGAAYSAGMRTWLLALFSGSSRTAGPRSQARLASRLRLALRPRDVLRLAILVVALSVGAAHAQDRLDALAAAVDRGAGTPRGEAAIVDRMAAVLALTPDRVRVSRVETRLGWGDLFNAHRLPTPGGHPIEQCVAPRRTRAQS